jgi:hypothetical protein
LKAQAGDRLESQLENLTADESRTLSWKAELEIGMWRESQAGRKARLNGRSPVQIGGWLDGSQKTKRRLKNCGLLKNETPETPRSLAFSFVAAAIFGVLPSSFFGDTGTIDRWFTYPKSSSQTI